MPAITRHQRSDLPERPLLTFLPLVRIGEVASIRDANGFPAPMLVVGSRHVSWRSRSTSQEADKWSLAGLRVLDVEVLPGLQLALNELVQRNRAVHDVRLGQAGTVLESLEILRG